MLKDWTALKNAKGVVIIGKYLENGDMIQIGSEVRLPGHFATIISCSLQPVDANESRYYPIQYDCTERIDLSSPMLDCLKNGLDFSPGARFRDRIRTKFRSTVHPLGRANHFLLVASFGRSNFRLS